jgi:nucleoside phosphorylase
MPLVDYLLLTPLDEEWRRVRGVLCPNHQNIRDRWFDTITYYLWKQPVRRPPYAHGDYLVVAASMGLESEGPVRAGVFTSKAVEQWEPDNVVLLGMASSLDYNEHQLGDVVVPDQIYGYEIGHIEGDHVNFRRGHTQRRIGAKDFDRIRAFRDHPEDYDNWQQECMRAATKAGLRNEGGDDPAHLEAAGPAKSGEGVVTAQPSTERKGVNKDGVSLT